MKEVHGGDNEPIGRLCPLGWTTIGTIGTCKGHGASNTGYLNTCMYHLYSGQSVAMEI